MCKRKIRVYSRVPYLGVDQEIQLLVWFGEHPKITVSSRGEPVTKIKAEVSGADSRLSLVNECLEEMSDQYEVVYSHKPSEQLVAAWTEALEKAWKSVISD